jgi:hypothetical protein
MLRIAGFPETWSENDHLCADRRAPPPNDTNCTKTRKECATRRHECHDLLEVPSVDGVFSWPTEAYTCGVSTHKA